MGYTLSFHPLGTLVVTSNLITQTEPPITTISITSNYYNQFKRVFGDGLFIFDFQTGSQTISILEQAIHELGSEASANYYVSTPGNAGKALIEVLHAAQSYPDHSIHVIH